MCKSKTIDELDYAEPQDPRWKCFPNSRLISTACYDEINLSELTNRMMDLVGMSNKDISMPCPCIFDNWLSDYT